MSKEIIEHDGVKYEIVREAEVSENHRYPGNVCYCATVTRCGDTPDEFGAVAAFDACWAIPELTEEQVDLGVEVFELIDWTRPDEVVSDNYRYHVADNRLV